VPRDWTLAVCSQARDGLLSAMAMAPSTTAALLAVAVGIAAGCGKSDEGHTSASPAANGPPPATTTKPPASAPLPVPQAFPAKANGSNVELQIATLGNTMLYDKTTLSVPTGTMVHLTLKNNSSPPGVLHNWVLVKPGTEANVASAGLMLGEPAGYFDVGNTNALAHTPLAKPGETVEVTFTAPAPGDYPYICTLPGHYTMMKGVLTVTP
jgi:azurin